MSNLGSRLHLVDSEKSALEQKIRSLEEEIKVQKEEKADIKKAMEALESAIQKFVKT